MFKNTKHDKVNAESNQSRWIGKKLVVLLPDWSKTYTKKNVGKVLTRVVNNGADVVLFCSPCSELMDFQKKYVRSKLVAKRKSNSILGNLIQVIILVRRFRPDLVMWSYGGYHENLAFAILQILGLGPKYIIKTDSYIPKIRNLNLSKWIGELLFFKIPGWFAEIVIVESQEIERRAKNYYRNKIRAYLLPNGIPLMEFKKYKSSFLHERSQINGPYILYTGRIMHSKGIDLLINAFIAIANQIPAWKLVIVGPVWETDYMHYCRNIAFNGGLIDQIIFVGFTEGEDLYRWYNFAEIYVLPSRDEGLANRLPEAMYFENPIIAFDVGQTRSMVDESCGILLQPEDVRGLQMSLIKLALDEKLRKTKGNAARKRVEDGYDDEKLITNFLKQVEEIL
jgi:glycosyltransferase involved in cell wall biosynthesis